MSTANQRIAKNTGYMYVRLFTMTVIGLYTSRLVLEILGVSDFGLFAVVGGVLAMFTFISGSLSKATARFLNTEMGRPDGNTNATFNICLLLHCLLALVVALLAETIGLWYVLHKLNVAAGKMDDALIVYHISIATACLGIINSPYQSLFGAHERFGFLMVVDTVNSFLRLGCILLLTLYEGPYALRLYAVIFSLTTINTFIVYHLYAHKAWHTTVRLRFVRGWQQYKEVLVFNNWNMLATIAYMARTSGADLLINAFFNTAVNGAFAISKTVNTYVADFSTKFDGASAPQVIQAYAAGNKPRYTYLCNKLGRFTILLFELLCFPMLIELGFLLHLWLGQVPEGAVEFTRLNIIIGGVSVTCGGIYNLINATGRIKWFKIEISVLMVLCLPVGYVLFRQGYPATTLLVLFILADATARVIQLILMRRLLGFDSWQYVRQAYFRPGIIALLMSMALYGYAQLGITAPIYRLCGIAACFALTAALVWTIGLTQGERQKVMTITKRRLIRQSSSKSEIQ